MISKVKNFFVNGYQGLTDDHNRFGTISVLLIVVAVLGGIAVGYNMDSLLTMVLVTIGTMATEAFILAVQPMKRIVNLSLATMVVNIFCIFMGILT